MQLARFIQGIISGTTRGVTKGDARSLDYGSSQLVFDMAKGWLQGLGFWGLGVQVLGL